MSKIQTIQEIELQFEDVQSGAISFLDSRPVQISQSQKRRDEVTILADSSNTGTVYFGSEKNQDIPLAKGQSAIIKKAKLSQIWVQDSTSGDKVYFYCGGS